MQTALYLRVSTAQQRPDLQDNGLRAYAARAGLDIVATHVDHAVSGRQERRPQLQALMHAARRHAFACVLVWKFDDRWLLLDSRVVIGQFLCNSLFLQAFHEGRDRCGIFGKSLLISSIYVLFMLCKTPESTKSLVAGWSHSRWPHRGRFARETSTLETSSLLDLPHCLARKVRTVVRNSCGFSTAGECPQRSMTCSVALASACW